MSVRKDFLLSFSAFLKSSRPGVVVARRVLPVLLGIPLLLLFLVRVLQLAGVAVNIRFSPGLGSVLFLTAVILLIAGPIVWAVALFHRIDKRALQESEKRYRQLFENNPHPMWVYDTETLAFLAVNEAAAVKYGYSPEEFQNMTIKDIRPPEDHAALEKNLALGVRGYEQSGVWRHRKKDGTVIEVEIASHETPFAGRPSRLVLVTDITERKKIEAQLLRAQRMESIGTLAGGIAHDLNNVLAPILMATEILKERAGPSTRGLIEIMETSAKRGADIVRQVLMFARGVEGDRVPIQLRHVITNIQRMIGETFPKLISVQTNTAKDLWSIVGDPTQLDQVLLNLCVNARDAMPRGGILRINAENKILDEHYARLNLEAKAGPYVAIEVADTGIGIAPSNIEKIFEPFFTTKEVGKGTGLGLSTVRAIVQSHSGFVNVYSEPGKGTSFKLYLPAKESVEAVQATEKASDLPLGRGELILVVDDEAAVRDISRVTLESHNYRVLMAADGAQALGYYSQQMEAIRVVLLDMMMPIMDGSAAIRVLESLNPKVKIIAASGLMNKPVHVGPSEHMSPVVRAVLAKPFTAETLLRTVREVISTDN
jgi:hypothetical protein